MGIDLQTDFDFDTVGEHFPYRSSQEQRPVEGYSTVGIGNLKGRLPRTSGKKFGVKDKS